jgi:2,3-bisphosphoglycerate-independent phosphoglycerate mutase
METRRKPLLLIILDGWGLGEDWEFNALTRSGLKNFPRWLREYPNRPLKASGEAVGLPEGQMGNSEVGHLTLGAGRVLFQELPRISRSIVDGSFYQNPALVAACDACRERTLHLMGLFSDGGVHSHVDHLKGLVRLAKMRGLERVAIHPIFDGRDTPPNAGVKYLREFLPFLEAEGLGEVATLVGRYYAMDRDKRWERTEIAYRAYTEGAGEEASSPVAALEASYARGITDEFVRPVVLPCPYGRVTDGDGVIFFNFRADRARQIARAFNEEAFTEFQRRTRPALATYTCMTRYQKDFPFPVAFETQVPRNTFGEVLAQHGLTQLRIAETEKYAHVTFFFNGGRETLFPGEDRLLIPSPKVPTYDLKPAMSALEVTEALLDRLDAGLYDFVLLNLANPDMVGHTGSFAAACEAAFVVDQCAGRIAEKALSLGGAVALTADHGNLEQMREADGIHIHTAHTTNPVPFVWISRPRAELDCGGERGLASVAPTLLGWLGLPIPEEMDAPPLLRPVPGIP